MTDQPSLLPAHSRAEQLVKLGELLMRSQRDRDMHAISLTGEMDVANAGDVERELIRVETTGAATIVVDLSDLTFLASTGIRVLIVADARSRNNGHRLSLRRPPEHVQRVLRICGIADRLPFDDQRPCADRDEHPASTTSPVGHARVRCDSASGQLHARRASGP